MFGMAMNFKSNIFANNETLSLIFAVNLLNE